MKLPSKEKSSSSTQNPPVPVIPVLAIFVGAAISGLFNPEVRIWLGLDQPEKEVVESIETPNSPPSQGSQPCLDVNNGKHVANLPRFVTPEGTCIQHGSQTFQLPRSTVYEEFMKEQQSGKF